MESCRHVINDAAARDYQNMMTTVMSSTGSQPVSSLQGLQRGRVIRLTHQTWRQLALLLNLSDNYLKHARNNTVVVQQKEMDRVR